MRDDFVARVDAVLRSRLALRDRSAPTSVLGAGHDDLDRGREYLQALAGTGLAVPTWPREHGGLGATPDEVATVRRALDERDVPDLYPYLVGLELVGPTLLAHGTAEQCARFLPRIASGEEIWCQGFSEPDAGSDLAAVATHAVRDHDRGGWRLSGQKVWTSRGAYAQRGLWLARHDPSLPKNAGITAFALDMRDAGVHVRPLRQMNGDTHFSEVFVDGAFVADADRIGEPGDGWRVAMTTLSFERGAVSGGGSSGMLDVAGLVALARETGRTTDPVVRDQLARLVVESRVMALTAQRARDLARGGRPGPEGSGMKLRGTHLFRSYAALLTAILGPAVAASDAAGRPRVGDHWRTLVLTAPSLSIRGGTDEIQRNIVGERALGLPPEPRVDRDAPFARRAAQA